MALLITASRFAEYIGWMAQENGDETTALRATAEAVELAQAGGDTDLAAYALVRRALVTYYDGDAPRTIALARQAQRSAAPPGSEVWRPSARPRDMPSPVTKEPAEEPWNGRAIFWRPTWTHRAARCSAPPSSRTRYRWWRGGASTTWAAPGRLPTCWSTSLRRIAPHALNARARYGLRHALALAASGEIERSCETARELLAFMSVVPRPPSVRTFVGWTVNGHGSAETRLCADSGPHSPTYSALVAEGCFRPQESRPHSNSAAFLHTVEFIRFGPSGSSLRRPIGIARLSVANGIITQKRNFACL